MTQISARVPDEMAVALDAAAQHLQRSRAHLIREALERYLEDYNDLNIAVARLQDPDDSNLDWDEARRDLLGSD